METQQKHSLLYAIQSVIYVANGNLSTFVTLKHFRWKYVFCGDNLQKSNKAVLPARVLNRTKYIGVVKMINKIPTLRRHSLKSAKKFNFAMALKTPWNVIGHHNYRRSMEYDIRSMFKVYSLIIIKSKLLLKVTVCWKRTCMNTSVQSVKNDLNTAIQNSD